MLRVVRVSNSTGDKPVHAAYGFWKLKLSGAETQAETQS